MCGITGAVALGAAPAVDSEVLDAMTATLVHRGPDAAGRYLDAHAGLGFRRLSIVGIEAGDQPIRNEDGSLVLVCNGEIFNHRELRAELEAKGHRFTTRSDVEVIVHLFEEHGTGLLDRLNGQFAFALYDRRRRSLLLARDQMGILPLYYARTADQLVFGSEIKAVLEHPAVERAVDLTGLDQVLTFPGPVSPRTVFRGVSGLKGGEYLLVEDGVVRTTTYWDLEYPPDGVEEQRPDEYWIETLRELLSASVHRRLQADVPVGYYLSGGLDSSLIAALVHGSDPGGRPRSFSIAFGDSGIDESRHQRTMVGLLGPQHHETRFEDADIADELLRMVWHAETPVKETYNTCSLVLSRAVRDTGTRVILTGEGADELFGGYIGYRFDHAGRRTAGGGGLDSQLEREARQTLWGDPAVFYERDYHAWRESKLDLYALDVVDAFPDFDALRHPVADGAMLRGRHPLHQRSYLDFKLRLTDHLLTDHGDRMALANSVEARYPFLDIDVVRFATRIPARLKVHGGTEKYVLKQAARGLVPEPVIRREKFGFRAPGSPALLRQHHDWIGDMLAHDRIKRQGYFNPEVTELLKNQYTEPGFDLHPHLGDDLLLVVLTFGILLDSFGLPDYS